MTGPKVQADQDPAVCEPAPRDASGIVSAMGFAAKDAAIARVRSFIELVRSFNAKMDLTAARSEDELLDLLVADAALLAASIEPGRSVVDVGAGAGAPGLCLALLRDDLRVTLVEPLDKRVMFLRTVIGRLATSPIKVERARGEALVGRARFDVAISRATLAPPAWLDLARGLVVPGGEAWVLLAQGDPPDHASFERAEDRAYAWPLTGVARRAVRYRAAS